MIVVDCIIFLNYLSFLALECTHCGEMRSEREELGLFKKLVQIFLITKINGQDELKREAEVSSVC